MNIAIVNAMSQAGVLVIHASAFEWHGKGVLAIGPAGIGKSTLAASAWVSGGKILSDDSVLLDISEAVKAYAYRRDASIRSPSIDRLPKYLQKQWIAGNNGKEQKWFLIRDKHPTAFTECLRVDEIWVLSPPSCRPAPRKSRITAAAAFASIMEANPYLASKHSVEREATKRSARDLLQNIPAFRVDLTQNLFNDPHGILSQAVP